jgi:hypothetical protein
MTTPGQFTLESQNLGCLPIVNFFLTSIGVADHLQAYLPSGDARLRLTPATVVALVVRNLVVGHRPVYALGEWAGAYDPGMLGLAVGDVEMLNDDRVGRTLDRLFDADRASLITATVLAAGADFDVATTQLHNDSTTVTAAGNYPDANGRERGGKPTPAIRHGHNKDFRPDLLQLLFILTISADGAAPIAYRVADGNTPDDAGHIPTWDQLRALVGSAGFLYVADSKLCSKQAMGHIASHGGRFVTVVPHGRREDTWFRQWVQTHAPTWQEAKRAPGSRLGDPDRVWRTFEAPAPSVDGYRMIWVHSSTKAARDGAARAARIEAGLTAIDAAAARLASPKTRIKTRVAAEEATTTALTAAGATRWLGFTINATSDVSFHQELRGRPGTATRYRRAEKPVFTIAAAIRADNVAYDAATDGCFPTITNDTVMTPAQVLAAYHYQQNLERRHHILKGPQDVAPVYLETPHRIEALLLCHFLTMLVEALIEREIRTSMKTQGLAGIPLYPELRNCPAPSAPRILEIFKDVKRHQLISGNHVVQTFQPQLTPVQQQVLELLHIPANLYT